MTITVSQRVASAVFCILAVITGLLAVADGGYYLTASSIATLVIVGLVIALVVGRYGYVRPTDYGRFGKISLAGLAAFVAYCAWSALSAQWSDNTQLAWNETNRSLLYAAVLFLGAWLSGSVHSVHAALYAFAVVPTLIALYTLLQLSQSSGLADLFAHSQLLGVVGYHNAFGAVLMMGFWLCITLASTPGEHWAARISLPAAATLLAMLSILTQSRGTLLSSILAGAIFIAIFPARRRAIWILPLPVAAVALRWDALNAVYTDERIRTGSKMVDATKPVVETILVTSLVVAAVAALLVLAERFLVSGSVAKWGSRVVAVICIVAVVVGAAVAMTKYDPVGEAQGKWKEFRSPPTEKAGKKNESRYSSVSNNGRLELWWVAQQDFKKHPLQGVGAGNYEATYYQLRRKDAGFIRQPHNLTLEVAAERGAIGLALIGIFAFAVALRGHLGRWGHGDATSKALLAGIATVVAYWAIHAQLEWFWQFPAVTIPAFFGAGLILGMPWSDSSEDTITRYFRKPVQAAVGTIALVSLFSCAVPLIAQRYISVARAELRDGSSKYALRHAKTAGKLTPGDPAVHLLLAGAYDADNQAPQAIAALKDAEAADRNSWSNLAHIAEAYKSAGEPLLAQRAQKRSEALNPYDYRAR